MHTPGPWDLIHRTVSEKPIKIREHYAIVPKAGPSIALLPDGREARPDIQRGNAFLIASAPDLLEALKGLVIWSERTWAGGSDEVPNLKEARAAIAKATGNEKV